VKGLGSLFFHIAEHKLYIFNKKNDRIPWAVIDMRAVSLEREVLLHVGCTLQTC
jgi:hypothetical protein